MIYDVGLKAFVLGLAIVGSVTYLSYRGLVGSLQAGPDGFTVVMSDTTES